VHWDAAGLPVLTMTADEELPASLASVQVRVVVAAATDPGVDPGAGGGTGTGSGTDGTGGSGTGTSSAVSATRPLAITGASVGGLLALALAALAAGTFLRRRARQTPRT
jgi:hypothetical protein